MVELVKDDQVAVYADFDNRARRAAVKQHRRSKETLPVIDFAPFAHNGDLAARKRIAADINAACRNTGFFYLVNHGISEAEFEVAHAYGLMLFELPRADKAAMAKINHPARNGWMAIGGVKPEANSDPDADQKETFNLPRDWLPGEERGSNPMVGNGFWPDAKAMPGFRDFIMAHIMKRVAIGQQLARAMALSLDLPEDFLDEAHRYPNAALTYNWYPALNPDKVGQTQWGISPHTDYGSFTLLSQDALGGLEVRSDADEWIDVPPLPGAFVINLGDLFSRWTNGVYKSSLHRASNFNPTGRARISLPLFFNPNAKARVECLPTCQGPGNPPKFEPVEAGPFVRALVAQSERTGRPGITQKTIEDRFVR